MGKTLLSFGYGYSAQALAPLLGGWRMIGTSRTASKPVQNGIERVQFPGEDMGQHLDAATHLLISAGPNQEGDPVLRELRDEIAKRDFEWVGYLSTTGVYGDHQGGWVDEDTPLTPSTRRG